MRGVTDEKGGGVQEKGGQDPLTPPSLETPMTITYKITVIK